MKTTNITRFLDKLTELSIVFYCIFFIFFSVPDLPPADVTAKLLDKTEIRVRWGLVPLGYRCGIITGYRISYNSSDSNTSFIDVPSDASDVILTSLAKFTFYYVYVQAHTIKGNGPAHYLKVATYMGGREVTSRNKAFLKV